MNFFTDELKKITDRSEYIQKPKFVGQSCVFRLSDDVTGKLQFVTRGHADNYTALKLSLFNKREGPIDIQIMNIVDVIGRKRVLGELRSPYIWKYGNDIDWYSYHPDNNDYSAIEKRSQNTGKTTDNQKLLISELIKEFPIVKRYLEYEDYTKSPTAENASELISTIIERHADVIGNRRNFVGYMAMRPGTEKRGEHGLFNDSDEPINLNAVANEVAEHPGYVWTHVVSLRREDAVRLGYTNSDMWRELVKRHIDDISKAQNIPLANMKWYAAFHDTTHHPHIHLIVYSSDPRQGYLTKDGMAAIRSAFANDIFHEDMKSIYHEQTLTRDELKALSEDQMSEILSQIGSGVVDERLVIKVRKLNTQLQSIANHRCLIKKPYSAVVYRVKAYP